MELHCSHVMHVQMSLSDERFLTCPSVALRTIVLGAKFGLYLATGQTVVHLPHSTQSNAPVSSISWSIFFLRSPAGFLAALFLGIGFGPSARICSVNSFIV